ncbi:MAG: putative esterase, partial [Planctomycetota bacterium]
MDNNVRFFASGAFLRHSACMKAMLTWSCAAILGLMLSGLATAQGAEAQTPEQLVASLSEKGWRLRNRAARALMQQANDLSEAVQKSLWELVGDDVDFFERGEFDTFEIRITPREWPLTYMAAGYHPVPEVFVPSGPSDLVSPFNQQVLALLVLQQISTPSPEHLSACLAAAEDESDLAVNQMLLSLLASFGDAAVTQLQKTLVPAETKFFRGEQFVDRLRLLPHLGEPGWSVLHEAAIAKDRPKLRRAAIRVIGMSKRDVEVDLFVARRLFADKEVAPEACGVLTMLPASDEDPALVDWLIEAFARTEGNGRLRILGMLAQTKLRGRAAKATNAFLVRALGSDELPIAELAIKGLGRRAERTPWVLRQPAVTQKLIALAHGGNVIAMQATALLRKLASKDDALMARLLDDELLAVADLRKIYGRKLRLPAVLEARYCDAFLKAVDEGNGSNQVRLARAFVAKSWWQVIPDVVGLFREELQSGVAERVAAVSRLVGFAPNTFQGLVPQFRELAASKERAVSQAGWRGLVSLVHDELPAAIEAKHISEWHAHGDGLEGRMPRGKLIALFDDDDDDVAAVAALFLARDPESIPDLFAGMRHSNELVRKACMRGLPWRMPKEHGKLLVRATKRLRAQLADADTLWSSRMEAARTLMELGQVGAADVAVLCELSSKLKLGDEPQAFSSQGILKSEPVFREPTRWEVFSEIERLPATKASFAWLQQGSQVGRPAVFRSYCRDLLSRFLRRDWLVGLASEWFRADEATRAAFELPNYVYSKRDTHALVPLLFSALREVVRETRGDFLPPLRPDDPKKGLEPSTLQVGDYKFPYVLLVKGEQPSAGWPLFICMHGGGGNGKASGPHAWSVNTREWQAQKFLFRGIYEPAGIYFIPRMADDRRGRWWHDHNQIAFEQVIEQCLLFRDVDANRVYLMGISEGGYGAIRFAGNRPDRFAATGGMAAAEPIGTSLPENMRNVAMRIDIGEKDIMFDR